MSAGRLVLPGAKLFYTVEGSGTPILLIHGWTSDQNDWSIQIPLLISLGFSVIAFDHRGHGHSTVDADSTSFDPPTLAKDAVELLTHLGIGRGNEAIIMGHSLGGLVANEICFRYPEYVRGVVLVDPAYEMPVKDLDYVTQLLTKDIENCPLAASNFLDSDNIFPPQTPVWLRPWLKRKILGDDPRVVASTFMQMASYLGQSESEYLKKTKKRDFPRLVTCALETSVDIERQAGLDNSFDRVELIPAGHFHFIVEADRFNAILQDWLRQNGFIGSV
ncbi:Alpha/Beta hydrolase protein [Kockiozyma suomiensis]|uniref:Alpha/Beta hydrolase protein n=1 Tax=Kockiozyma suomiensis TaxID=1337062 RepID=UPI0033430559